ncbi:MAG: transcriptional regulator [Chitinophagaceae bacterium]|nr:transcriptional regulator [Chitinophagaceae bacterium]
MDLEEAKKKFIHSWGTLGSQWGINRTMSQIHALLLVSAQPLSTEGIMQDLNISRGNANMNLRALMDWGLISKEHKPGDRKEYFAAGKDIWETARKITAERRKREIEPVLQVLDQLKKESITGGNKEDIMAFQATIQGLDDFTGKANDIVGKFIKSDSNWFYKTLMKLLH